MKVAFLSAFALDANASLINALSKKCEVYFFIEALYEISNFINKEKLSKTITVGTEVEELRRFRDFISLEKTYVIKGTRNLNILKKLYISYKVNQYIKEINPDIIILDNYMLTYFVSTLEYRKKMLMVVHDPFLHSGENKTIDRYLRKLHFKLIKHKILLNENQKNEFIQYYNFDKNDIYTSFLGVYDFLKYHLTENEENIKTYPTFNVLFFGRISPYKGIRYLLDAFVEILSIQKNIKISLTVAGSGDFNFDIQPYKQYNEITFINKYLYPEELAKLIYKSSVVICPYTDATQSGVVMSAFAFKKPVVATNVGGLPEMVEQGKTGLIIEPKNSEEIYKAILKLHQDRDLLHTMSENIEKTYFYGEKSWEASAKLFINAMKNIINNLN